MSLWVPLAAATALVAHPLPSADVLEPSVLNEVAHALAVAPTNPPPCALAFPFGTNSQSAAELAIRLVSTQKADGRWWVGTNDVTAAAVAILKGLE